MRIVIFSNTAWSIYNYRRNLIAMLQAEGLDVHVIAPPDSYVEKIKSLGVTYHKLDMAQSGRNPFGELLVCIRLLAILKSIRPGTVLTFTAKCNLYTGLIGRVLKFRHIANISGLGQSFDKKGLFSSFVKLLYKYCLKKTDRVFFQNAQDMALLADKKLIDKDKAVRIPGSGVDIERFRPAYTTDSRCRRFLMFGRLIPKKRYDLFIKAAENILNSSLKAEFLIMGIKDNNRKNSLRLYDLIMEKHKAGIIKYIEPCDNVEDVILSCDVVVLPSEYNEGVPRTLLEASACGRPVITTNRKGCRDTVDNEVSGYLIEPGSLDSLQNAIIKMIQATADQLMEMGRSARAKAETQFDERFVLSEYLKEIKI